MEAPSPAIPCSSGIVDSLRASNSPSPSGSPQSPFSEPPRCETPPPVNSSGADSPRSPPRSTTPRPTTPSIPVRPGTPSSPLPPELERAEGFAADEREAASALVALFGQLNWSPVQSPKKRHRRTNDELSKDFKCPSAGCSKSYASAGALKTHMGLKHISAPVVPLSPSKRHQSVHSGSSR